MNWKLFYAELFLEDLPITICWYGFLNTTHSLLNNIFFGTGVMLTISFFRRHLK
jgi:hypothetical protein